MAESEKDDFRYLSVCSGIEAASVAWKPLGWKPAAYSDIEDFPREVLKHRHGAIDVREREAADRGVPLWGDFTTIRPSHFRRLGIDPDISLLVGGTPCQSFSLAGLRKGLGDSRGSLALQFLVLARRFRPRWVLWENVPGVLSADEGRAFGSFLGGLEELGYGWAYRVLDAQYVRVDGFPGAVPQRRRRVFVVGYLGDWRPASAVLFEPNCLSGNHRPRRQTGAFDFSATAGGSGTGGATGKAEHPDLAGLLTNQGFPTSENRKVFRTLGTTPTHGSNSEGMVVVHPKDSSAPALRPLIGLLNDQRGHCFQEEDGEISPTLMADSSQPVVLFPEDDEASEDGKVSGIDMYNQCDTGEVSHTLSTSNVPGVYPLNEEGTAFSSGYGGKSYDGVSPTVLADSETLGALTPAGYPRKLTPRECERLQGFPDDFTCIPWEGRGKVDEDWVEYLQEGEEDFEDLDKLPPDSLRYRALGNSMAVNVMRWIGQRIKYVDDFLADGGADGPGEAGGLLDLIGD